MGQYFELLNIDKKQKATDIAGRKLGEFLFSDDHRELISSIRAPCQPDRKLREFLAEGRAVQQRGPLSKLSIELLYMIYDYLPAVEVFLFAITCKSLLEVGKAHILRKHMELHAPWMDNRLILLGDYCDDGQEALPQSLLTDAEWQEIVEVSTSEPRLDNAAGEVIQPSLVTFAGNSYASWREWFDAITRTRYEIEYKIYNPKTARRFQTDEESLDQYHFSRLWTYPEYPKGSMVLCNISKGEYVSDRKLTVPDEVTLAHVLLVWTAWTSEAEYAMPVMEKDIETEIMRGRWARDRFRVVTMETLPALPSALKEWKDVTAEASRLLGYMWKTEKGDHYSDAGSDSGSAESN